ncbi:hypothetical protein OPTIMUS_105 [Mycobacterium phage Optimus]|uniref:Uncharacterized protein n=2 Tax=Omegavirus TaxID=1623292 RepID=A0A3S9UAY6_9CAUD|nr:hypothetical protein N857_gp114 [Mycobacterium phage Wanda]YP_009590961.1 hypothetical protein FDG54_gp105 [Mycobacterium phage Optimus]ATN89824.1 hypothetical protein SEA_KLEIN_111 [Mycobacterium phage Klein]AZS07446.1 hypothetical protein PBI_DUKE13_107 [Mycobacterium phage Duke13]QDM57930.1 hypothetical protein SEA_NIHILNOMEN_113 [Mycobacterium phage NihilNomen]QQM15261.1 membrane protein [Mycobacterium phage Pound]AEJ92161.1 hypothetical protein OPTIMUS_105 [Mycobacterium phage Optimus
MNFAIRVVLAFLAGAGISLAFAPLGVPSLLILIIAFLVGLAIGLV